MRIGFSYIYKTEISEIQYIIIPLRALLVFFRNKTQLLIYSNEEDVARIFHSVPLRCVITEEKLYLNVLITN